MQIISITLETIRKCKFETIKSKLLVLHWNTWNTWNHTTMQIISITLETIRLSANYQYYIEIQITLKYLKPYDLQIISITLYYIEILETIRLRANY